MRISSIDLPDLHPSQAAKLLPESGKHLRRRLCSRVWSLREGRGTSRRGAMSPRRTLRQSLRDSRRCRGFWTFFGCPAQGSYLDSQAAETVRWSRRSSDRTRIYARNGHTKGGAQHVRFRHKFLYDLNYVSTIEPFQR